jgi:hypothetical protein
VPSPVPKAIGVRGDPVAERAGGRAGEVRHRRAVVTYAGCPTAAPHAASNMSTTGGGQLAAVSRRNSSGESSWNARRRPSTSPMTATCRA